MATVESTPPSDLGAKLQALPRPVLYLLLVLATMIPLWFDAKLPNKPNDYTVDLYTGVMSIPEGSTVLISTEWTTGTRAENAGEFEALLRMLMHRNIKFAIFSIADPQAPPVAKNEIADLNAERVAKGEKPYERWNDWIDVGFFPNAEGTANALAASVKNAFAGKKDLSPAGVNEDVFKSPVLAKVSTLKDIPMFFNVTASSTSTVYIQRISGKVNLALLVTGVMGPEAVPYYSSGQVKGLASGLKGVYDLETLMEQGVNTPDKDGKVANQSSKVDGAVAGFVDPKDPTSKGKGQTYYPALHVALLLLILAIIAGNVGMFMSKGANRA